MSERYGAIVFTDIVGFTELTEQHGDDLALELVEQQERTVRELLPPTGRIVKELGDGLLLWFDDLADGVVTSLALQHCFDGPAVTAADATVPLWVRIGVHWGAPRWRGDDIIGRDVNLTSRLTALAGAGEVICSGAVVDAWTTVQAPPEPAVHFIELGPAFVKGIPDAVRTYRVESEPPVDGDRWDEGSWDQGSWDRDWDAAGVEAIDAGD